MNFETTFLEIIFSVVMFDFSFTNVFFLDGWSWRRYNLSSHTYISIYNSRKHTVLCFITPHLQATIQKTISNNTYWFERVFWLNIAKNQVYLWYGHCLKLFRKIRREVNFGNGVAEILRESMRKKREMMWQRERNKIEFWWCYRNSYPKCKLSRLEKCLRGKTELWQPNCQNCRGEERENLIRIVAIKLLKFE